MCTSIGGSRGEGRQLFAAIRGKITAEGPVMTIKVLYFGRLKELSGLAEELVELREGAVIEDLFVTCSAERPGFARFRPSLVAARNREFAAWDTPLRGGDEIGFLPPVSGG
jgi:molybdopterin converting factor small subunit